ncbi:MAG: O-antigen ligase family protein [Elusimicrobia bacterium]|nr:O-antigen ligase family protein [Elusimicrobiota bacterium]
MLPLLIGLLVAGGPLLRGSWDLWAQSLLFIAVVCGSALWVLFRLFVGYFPLPSTRNLAWTGVLAALSGWAAFSSPVASYSIPAWRALLLGLWIFPAIMAVSKDERSAVDEAVRAVAWVLVLLAFYQHFRQGIERPSSAFLNQNIFAGTVLMLLPLCVQKRDWILCAGLLCALAWSRSVGAWLGLAGALTLNRRQAGSAAYRVGTAIGLVCLVIIYAKLKSPDVLHRWYWWQAALRMVWDRPWLGLGPNSFAYALPAYQRPGVDLSALYAHQHFLETAAESGLPYVLIWTAGLLHCLRRGGSHKRFGAVAILIQSLWDYSLSIPANFWLFCYFSASTISESKRGVNIASGRKLPLGLLVATLAYGLCSWTWRGWQADRLKAQAVEKAKSGAPPGEVLSLLEGSSHLLRHPETERYAAEMEMGLAKAGPDRGAHLVRAAAHLEVSTELNPYRASSWSALSRVYLELGEPGRALQAMGHGALFCPALRAARP